MGQVNFWCHGAPDRRLNIIWGVSGWVSVRMGTLRKAGPLPECHPRKPGQSKQWRKEKCAVSARPRGWGIRFS